MFVYSIEEIKRNRKKYVQDKENGNNIKIKKKHHKDEILPPSPQ